jgi:hypothetical protein
MSFKGILNPQSEIPPTTPRIYPHSCGKARTFLQSEDPVNIMRHCMLLPLWITSVFDTPKQTEHRDSIRELTKASLVAPTLYGGSHSAQCRFASSTMSQCLWHFRGFFQPVSMLHNNDATSRFEEAGHYLTTLKHFEHKPPDMIKERVDKDYHSILRTALTSISKVNKTDVETLRTSFGVSRHTFRQIPSARTKEQRVLRTYPKQAQTNCETFRDLAKSKSRILRMHSTSPSGIKQRGRCP